MANRSCTGQGSLFFPKIGFFLKPNNLDLSFGYRNANVVFIEKSDFFLKSLKLALKGPKEVLKGLGSSKKAQ